MSGPVPTDTESLDTIHYVAVALAAVTGVVHLTLGVADITTGLGVSFVLAGLGYFGAIALVFAGVRRRLLYVVGVPYTAVQVVLWYWLNYGSTGRRLATLGAVEVVDKVAQLGLIVALVVLYRRSAA